MLLRLGLLLFISAGVDPASGQVADTVAGPEREQVADSFSGPVDDVEAGFGPIWTGRVLTDSIAALHPALDLVDLLADDPASFTYWFGTPGWPDGWSYRGLPPHTTGLVLDDRPFTHLFTGRPADQLLPLAVVEAPELGPGPFGRPVATLARLRPFVASEPLTEAKYWRGDEGLQSIDAVHAQHRRRELFGKPGFLNVLGAYSGRAANGEYPGSRLRRARQVMVRARYRQQGWSIEVANLHNRRFVGAHGGVIPDPGAFETIYIRPGATVESPDARRRILRNDLSATARLPVLERDAAVSLFWTAETFRYTTSLDTIGTRSDRTGFVAALPVVDAAGHRLSVDISAWRDAVAPQHDFAPPTFAHTQVVAFLRDSLHVGTWRMSVEGGLGAFGEGIRPLGGVSVAAGGNRLSLSASVRVSEQRDAPLAETGFGSLGGLGAASGVARSAGVSRRVLQGSTNVRMGAGGIDVEIGGFASRLAEPLDYFAVGVDSATVREPSTSLTMIGAYGVLGVRADAARGLYARFQSTIHAAPRGTDPLIGRIADTIPRISGRARIGARFVIFQRDLDVDAFAEMIAWSATRSRTLHPESGLLVVPESSAREFGPSSMLNVVAEAAVRGATLFLVYENALSGTTLMTGNLLIPVYPLPARRFRFGVYWPIFG